MRLRHLGVPKTPLRIFDCRNGIPPLMQASIDQESHVHGFDGEHGFCLFGPHGTVKLSPGSKEARRPDGL